jgi:hypothetical protein
MEKLNFPAMVSIKCLTTVVFPEPLGAEKIMALPINALQ